MGAGAVGTGGGGAGIAAGDGRVLEPQRVQEVLGHVVVLLEQDDRSVVVAHSAQLLEDEVRLPPPTRTPNEIKSRT